MPPGRHAELVGTQGEADGGQDGGEVPVGDEGVEHVPAEGVRPVALARVEEGDGGVVHGQEGLATELLAPVCCCCGRRRSTPGGGGGSGEHGVLLRDGEAVGRGDTARADPRRAGADLPEGDVWHIVEGEVGGRALAGVLPEAVVALGRDYALLLAVLGGSVGCEGAW